MSERMADRLSSGLRPPRRTIAASRRPSPQGHPLVGHWSAGACHPRSCPAPGTSSRPGTLPGSTRHAPRQGGRTGTDRYRLPPGREVLTVDLKLEVVILPVSDVDRSKQFYKGLGWREDADIVGGADFRIVQLTPPGSACSVSFGIGVTTMTP